MTTESTRADLEKAKRTKAPAWPVTGDRLPPHSLEAEAGVLGCCLLDPGDALCDALEALPESQAFYDARHQCIFETLRGMQRDQVAVDLITLPVRLQQGGVLEEVGGLAYLAGLQDATPSAANLPYYLGIVREKHTLRRWLALCAETTARIWQDTPAVEDLSASISTALFKLCEAGQSAGERLFKAVLADVQEQVLDKFQRGVKHKIGPMTGFNYLDNILPGFAPGQLIVEAARPRTGKSAKLMQTAEYIAAVEKLPVAVFSLEMSATSLGTRAVFQRAGADLTKFLNGFMADADVQKLASAAMDLCGLPLFIDESPRLAIEDLEIRARRMKRQHGIGIFFIDYFQLLFVRNRHKQWSKSDELAECSMRLKALARELKTPIYVAAQMNRQIEQETNRRPRLADLRDTGQLEQDADVVMFLWKPDITTETWVGNDSKPGKIADILPRVPVPETWRQKAGWKKNLAIVECTVEKQREGRSGEDATLVFIKPWTRFVDAYRPPRAALEEGQVEMRVED
ncbi:MAG: replicative DNA helicase [Anaerolineales bacterium]|nr:replicative DNA helicase [Anaerolineales bacterium]